MTDHQAHLTKADLLRLSQAQLDALYRERPHRGATPAGDTAGTVMALPGRRLGAPLRILARWLVWQGKVVAPAQDELKNRITPLRVLSIRALVYPGESWMDGRESTIIDYSRTSIVARWVRDEVREVAPGLWLGKVFIRRWHAIDFVLEARGAAR